MVWVWEEVGIVGVVWVRRIHRDDGVGNHWNRVDDKTGRARSVVVLPAPSVASPAHHSHDCIQDFGLGFKPALNPELLDVIPKRHVPVPVLVYEVISNRRFRSQNIEHRRVY